MKSGITSPNAIRDFLHTNIFEGSCRNYRRLTVVFLLLIIVGCTVGIMVPAGAGWDFANFYDAGRKMAVGQVGDLYNPDSLIRGEQPQGTMRFWGVPISATFYVPLSWFPAESALVIFKLQNVLAYFAALTLLYLHNRKFADHSSLAQWRFAAVFTFLSLIYQPFWTVFRIGGQTTPTVFLLLSLALLAHMDSRFFWSGLLLALAALIKPALAPALIFLIIVSGLQFFRSTVAVLSLAGLASLFLLGWRIHEEFLDLMLTGSQTTFPWFYNSSLYILVENLRSLIVPETYPIFYDTIFDALIIGVKMIVIVTFIYLTARSRPQQWSQRARRHFDFLVAVSFFLLISQTLWEHYLSLLFMLLVYIIASHRRFSRGALTLVAAIFFLAVGQNLIFTNFLRAHFVFDTVAELLFIGLFKSGPVLLTLIFLWRYHQELFQSYLVPDWAS